MVHCSHELGYTIIYVADVPATVAFYEKAFEVKARFVHESNLYAELDIGSTAAFAGEPMAALSDLQIRPNLKADVAAGFQIAFVTDDPDAVYQKALAAGASAVKPPVGKPLGQMVGYLRDLNGCLVEQCSPMAE